MDFDLFNSGTSCSRSLWVIYLGFSHFNCSLAFKILNVLGQNYKLRTQGKNHSKVIPIFFSLGTKLAIGERKKSLQFQVFLPSDADSVKVVVGGGGGAHFGLFFISFCYKLLIVNFYYFSNVYVYISNKTAVAFFFFSSSYSCYSGNVTFVKIYGKFSSNFSPRLVLGLRVFFSNTLIQSSH